MQFIKRMRIVPVDDDRYFMLNGMTGAIDLIDNSVYQLYLKWKEAHTIEPIDSYEAEMLTHFQNGEYLMEPEMEEEKVTQLFAELQDSFLQTKPRVAPTFLLTYDCNFRCSYCYEQNLLDKGREKITQRLTPQIVDQLFKSFDEKNMVIGDIVLYGGEPLLLQNRDTINAILSQAKQRDLGLKIVTNGYTLDEFAPLLATAKVKNIQITLDGDRQRHNQSRYTVNKQGTFDKIIQGISVARDYHLPITIRCNVELTDETQIQSLIKALEANALANDPNIRLYFAPVAHDQDQGCNSDMWENFLGMVDQHISHPMVVKDFLSKMHAIASVFFDQDRWVPKYAYCSAQFGQQVFDPWGHIYPCQVLVGDEQNAIGSFDEDGIHYNENYISWDQRSVANIGQCRDCALSLFCGGGCPLTPLAKHGTIDQPDCDQMNDTLDILLPYLYKNFFQESASAS